MVLSAIFNAGKTGAGFRAKTPNRLFPVCPVKSTRMSMPSCNRSGTGVYLTTFKNDEGKTKGIHCEFWDSTWAWLYLYIIGNKSCCISPRRSSLQPGHRGRSPDTLWAPRRLRGSCFVISTATQISPSRHKLPKLLRLFVFQGHIAVTCTILNTSRKAHTPAGALAGDMDKCRIMVLEGCMDEVWDLTNKHHLSTWKTALFRTKAKTECE